MTAFDTSYKKVCYGPMLPWEDTQKRLRNLSKEDAQIILHGYLNKEFVLGWIMRGLIENSPWLSREDLQQILDHPELDPFSYESLTSDQVAELMVAGKKIGQILEAAEKRAEEVESKTS